MIRLDYIKGVNIGRHRLLEKKVTGNVLGLWGVSGTGKSTVLQLLDWILNGSIEHPDPLPEFIRNNEAEEIKKMEGFAKFTVDGKPMEVDRAVTRAGTATRAVRWDKQGDKWETTEKSAAGAAALIQNLVGANQKAISSIVFIRQGTFGKLFSGLDSDRRDFFVRLLMLGHMEKIAGVVDTYRKQLMGTVQDLSTLKDQAETSYRQAQAYFEEVDDALSRMRSHQPEIDAGLDLTRLIEQTHDKEALANTYTAAMNEGLLAAGLDAGTFEVWEATARAELDRLRDALKTAIDRRRNRTSYETKLATLNTEIASGLAWLEKKSRADELKAGLAELADYEGKPDPRVRIGQLDRWEEAYREKMSYEADIAATPPVDEALIAKLQQELQVATIAAEAARAVWTKAVSEGEELRSMVSVAGAHQGGSCRMCGNEHPDPRFLEIAIANNKELVERLAASSNELEDTRRAAKEAADAANTAAIGVTNRLQNLKARLTETVRGLDGAPTGDVIVVERDELSAQLPAFDAAKSMRGHLSMQLSAIDLSGHQWTTAEIDQKKSDAALATQMLGMLPPMAEIEAEEKELTDQGVVLKAQHDRLTGLVAKSKEAKAAYQAQAGMLQVRLEELRKEKPYLMSSIAALGPVVTIENVRQVLSQLRDRQTSFDTQTGAVAAARRAMNAAGETLNELELRIAEQQSRIIIGKELENVKAAFMPSGITTEYLSHQFARIAVATQDHIAQMSADFMVIASEKRALSFDFLKLNEPNGSWLSQNRMSGGQQVKLAIAVLLAIHELIIPQVGLLVLDEPSTHLDTDSRIALAEVLKEIGNRGNFQLVVCDHSPELKDAYTDTIELSADPS